MSATALISRRLVGNSVEEGVESEDPANRFPLPCPGLPETLTGGQNTLDELLPGHLSVLVLVDTAEEVHDARLLVVHPAHVTLPPHVEVEVGELLQLWITINVNAGVLKGT